MSQCDSKFSNLTKALQLLQNYTESQENEIKILRKNQFQVQEQFKVFENKLIVKIVNI